MLPLQTGERISIEGKRGPYECPQEEKEKGPSVGKWLRKMLRSIINIWLGIHEKYIIMLID